MANKNTRKKPKPQQDPVRTRAAQAANAQVNANTNKKGEKRSRLEYLKGVRTEMKKVIWPTKAELGSYTALVLAACAFFALLFWAVDSGVLAALRGLLGINV